MIWCPHLCCCATLYCGSCVIRLFICLCAAFPGCSQPCILALVCLSLPLLDLCLTPLTAVESVLSVELACALPQTHVTVTVSQRTGTCGCAALFTSIQLQSSSPPQADFTASLLLLCKLGSDTAHHPKSSLQLLMLCMAPLTCEPLTPSPIS